MENFVSFLAPFLAVVFFMLLGVLIYFFYCKPCKRKEEDEDLNKEQRQQLNDPADCDFVEKKRSKSAVNDYFVVVHLWYLCTQTRIRSGNLKSFADLWQSLLYQERTKLMFSTHCIRQFKIQQLNLKYHTSEWVDGAHLEKTISKVHRKGNVDAKRPTTDFLWA